MLMIRFQRVGRKNDPAYRLVVGERRSKPQSSGMEVLGSYHPKTKETILKNDRILHWISKGARASDTVYNLLVARGVVRRKKRSVAPVKPPAPIKQAPEEEKTTSAENTNPIEESAASSSV